MVYPGTRFLEYEKLNFGGLLLRLLVLTGTLVLLAVGVGIAYPAALPWVERLLS